MILDDTLGAIVQQAAVTFASQTNNTVIAGVLGKTIKILQLLLVGGGNVNITLKSGTTALSGAIPLAANSAFSLNYNQLPLSCNSGDAFIITADAGSQVSGIVWYVQS